MSNSSKSALVNVSLQSEQVIVDNAAYCHCTHHFILCISMYTNCVQHVPSHFNELCSKYLCISHSCSIHAHQPMVNTTTSAIPSAALEDNRPHTSAPMMVVARTTLGCVKNTDNAP